jgi:flavin-dependent dehydrogenase
VVHAQDIAPASGRHALVVGGSMAGLLAARALAEHFDSVMIVERDRLPQTPALRAGVPQARHFHLLQAGGCRIIERLYPGISDELVAEGALVIDTLNDVRILLPNGWVPRSPSDIKTIASSRSLLEWHVRRRTLALPKVRVVDGLEVLGPLARDGRVVGVQVRERGLGLDAPQRTIHADLVVDASGRSSRLPEWLAALGYEAPEETIVNARLAYATRCYQREGWLGDARGVIIMGRAPDLPRGAAIYPIEDGQWVVTLGGYGDQRPPTDEEGFLAFARSMASPQIYEAIRAAQPTSAISGYARTENRLRHFERLRRWPEGLLALGDAVIAFNPIYGQGMTTAARSAELLGTLLAERGGAAEGFGRTFQRRLARLNADPWAQATSEDFRYPTTSGARGPFDRALHWYIDRVLHAASEDRVVLREFAAVSAMLKRPSALLRPGIVARVLRRSSRGRAASEVQTLPV